MRELDITLERNSPFRSTTSWRSPSSTPSTRGPSRRVIASRTSCPSPAGLVFPGLPPGRRFRSWSEGPAGPQARALAPRSYGHNSGGPRRSAASTRTSSRPGRFRVRSCSNSLSAPSKRRMSATPSRRRPFPETEFIKIRRLRLADEVPLAILTNYLPGPVRAHRGGSTDQKPVRLPAVARRQPQDRSSADLGAADDRGRGEAFGRGDTGGLPDR